MLRYSVRLNGSNFKQTELEWSEKYLSPDLSYISGVTSPSYNLDRFRYLASKNSYSNTNGVLSLNAHNEKRQGYIIVREKKYYIYSGSTDNYSIEEGGITIEYKFVFINGKYFYYTELDSESHTSGFTIDNILYYKDNNVKNGEDEPCKVACSQDATYFTIDTVYYIDDERVTIDGEEYQYERWEGEYGVLKYLDDGRALDPSEITDCSSIEFVPYEVNNVEEITKFTLTKEDDTVKLFDSISHCKYQFYVLYKNHYCNIVKVASDDSYIFYCEIPKYVLSGRTSEGQIINDDLETVRFPLYFTLQSGNEDIMYGYKDSIEQGYYIDSQHYSEHHIKNMNELTRVTAFIYIEEENVFLRVEHDILSTNYGEILSVNMNDTYASLSVGDKFSLEYNRNNNTNAIVYKTMPEGKETYFVFFNNKRYDVEKNLCDKAEIKGQECDIEYINGRINGVDCLVLINGEYVPMKLEINGDEAKVKRYGRIVSGSSLTSTTEASYNVIEYDGITIDNTKCIINKYENGDEYADIPFNEKYVVKIVEVIGNSTYICVPYFDSNDFTEEFARIISNDICDNIVDNQQFFRLKVKNNIFGEYEIDEALAFKAMRNPRSSSDFYNLFNDLVILVDSGYIHIPLSFNMDAGNNIIQDDIITEKFFNVEKKKAINAIVDMEKDVYVPKYMDSTYSGAATTFHPIHEMRFNFHFRTRNEFWKIDSEDNNWFITDYYPYKCMLNDGEAKKTLQTASDLMGLLYFTDDDVFYQRSKVAKSFMRLLFYDSTDPQRQSLLATSCVFMDEHALFKTFIDNSRQNIYDYAKSSGSTDVSGGTDCTDGNLRKMTKISVNTEFIGKVSGNTKFYPLSANTVNISENHRLSSRLIVRDKYSTDTSSEGFYLYIFKEYSEKLHPKPIYMKVEFNHAGIGKTIPFIIPMHWSGNTSDSGSTDYNIMYPEHSLQLNNENDVKELMSGTPLSYIYAQTYIPLYAVYDFMNKEYCYVFDNRYVSVNKDGTMDFNLFEMKSMREDKDYQYDIDEMRKDILMRKPRRGFININKNQFDVELTSNEGN